MKTPIYDYIMSYAESGILRMHMPGHKGKYIDNVLSEIYKLDITEITDAGNLFETEGIIAESEKNATAVFGTEATFYSVQGSTLCIQTMLSIMKYEKRKVLALRNSHRSFLSACALLDIDPEWIFPDYIDSIISGDIPYTSIEEKLRQTANACLYITSPDYFGTMADIGRLADICHKNGAVLLVDNAHGACLPFYEENYHPVHLGADMCCDSAHKMLPALTGAAYLHTGSKKYAALIKENMQLFASTSPSYLITCSLDLCNLFLEKEIRPLLKRANRNIAEIKSKISEKYFTECSGYQHEPLHFTLNAAASGMSGKWLADYLHREKIEYEYSDDTHMVMLFSPLDDDEVYEKVCSSLMKADPEKINYKRPVINFPVLEKYMSVREAAFTPHEEIPIYQAVGRICANVNVPCPPAVPIVVSGEIISDEAVKIMQYYNINTVKVIKI